MEEKRVLSFIHISDIHFRKESGDPYDIDNELRKAMLTDLGYKAQKELVNVCGVLVCGDLAFSGQESEFSVAKNFLNDVTKIFGISLKDVFCVAGNHDVNQSIARNSRIVECIQDDLVLIDKNEPDYLDAEIRKIQNDQFIKGILYEPLSAYNKCVKEMASDYSIEEPTWQSLMMLSEKYTLAIYGMNSVLVSNYKDHLDKDGNKLIDAERKMVINRKQIPDYCENVIYLSLCHHPPECWNNDNLEAFMDSRVKIQLYGHKHIQHIEVNDKRVRIGSGALHPERGWEWNPRYNWLEMWIEEDTLFIKVYPRVFDDTNGIFISDVKSCDMDKEYRLIEMRLSDNANEKAKRETEILEQREVRSTDIITKEIIYRFSILSESDKKRLLRSFQKIDYTIEQDLYILLKQLKNNNLEMDFLNAMKK